MISAIHKTELQQALKLTPSLLQSIKVLQMNSQELLEYLQHTMEENPVLDTQDSSDLNESYEELRQKASWIDSGTGSSSFSYDKPRLERGQLDRELESLESFLRDQLDRLSLPDPVSALCRYLIELLDENGYLLQEDLDSIQELNIPQALLDQALSALQSLEPAGIGCRTLSECLLLQLTRKPDVPSAAFDIVRSFLPELGEKRYSLICRHLGLSLQEVRTAETLISSLDPYPGRAFHVTEAPVYIRPDLFVVEVDGKLTAVLNEFYLPRLCISDYYTRLSKETDEKETIAYLQQKMQQAKWLLDCLGRRNNTLQRCADAILEIQYDFFTGESDALSPMSLTDLAQHLSLHLSTISRALQGKYLQCRQGTFPLRYFFSHAVGSSMSQQAIKRKLLELIRQEDPHHPLSDQKLCQLLSDDVVVARRTIAKYRTELGIASSSKRKR